MDGRRVDHARPDPTDPDLQEHVVDAFRVSPNDAISIPTIRGVLARDGREVSPDTIRETCEALVAAGVLECVTAMGAYARRYRLLEGDSVRRP